MIRYKYMYGLCFAYSLSLINHTLKGSCIRFLMPGEPVFSFLYTLNVPYPLAGLGGGRFGWGGKGKDGNRGREGEKGKQGEGMGGKYSFHLPLPRILDLPLVMDE